MNLQSGAVAEGTYNFLLVALSALFLAHFGLTVLYGASYGVGLCFWPSLIALALCGSSFAVRYLIAFLVFLALVLPAALVARVGWELLASLSAATACMLSVARTAERTSREGLEDLLTTANRLGRRVQRLQASKRKLQTQSTRIKIGQSARGLSSTHRTLGGQRAVYKFQRSFLLGLLELRSLENLAAWYRRALEGLGVERGLVLIRRGSSGRVGEAWGLEDPEGALAALLHAEGSFSLVSYVAERACILTREELLSNPMLEGARRTFVSRHFTPSLIVPGFDGQELVLLVVAGAQGAKAELDMTPTLLSPLLPIQERVIELLA